MDFVQRHISQVDTYCYGFKYSKENPKNINSHISSKPFRVPGFKDSESSLMKEFISRVEPMF